MENDNFVCRRSWQWEKKGSFPWVTCFSDLINSVRYVLLSRQIRSWMTVEPFELEQFQLKRLQALVTHAYTSVELYRRKWRQAGVTPDDIRSLADISKLPVITRDDFRHSPTSNILSSQFQSNEYYPVGTSGSSGSPLKMFVDKEKALLDLAVNLPQQIFGKRPITIASGLRDLFLKENIRFMAIVVDEQHSYESLYCRIFRQMKHTLIDSSLTPVEHISAINKKRPISLMTYPSVMRNICLAVKAGVPLKHQPELIMFTAEVLDPPLRNLIKSIFHAELMDIYAATEAGFMAVECPAHEGQHILAWKVIVELLGEDNREVLPGQPGRMVITDLFNRATPIIRYAGLGDYAVYKTKPCACGRTLPLLAHIEGRIVDSITLRNGRTVHPYHLTQVLEDIPYIGKFQIRQELRDFVRVLLVKDSVKQETEASFAHDSKLGRIILNRFEHIFDGQMRVELETVTDIPKQPGSHKFATVLSLVNAQSCNCDNEIVC